ncbi:MAG TPA: transporter substrate-binding domain-containing protein [Gaiellaceae bacterium]|nr:transporter substrate-binding domain-containing protein [Gaiellaceae bacterium]
MTELEDLNQPEPGRTSRGGLLKVGGLALLGTAGAAGLTAGGALAAPQVAAQAGGSVLDKWTRSKKARLGVDLSFPPLQYIDRRTKKPSGYMVELTQLMMKDLGVTPEWVQTPFAQLFAALAARKFDMVGIAATILPSRALQGWFADVPAFYESNVILVRKNSRARKLSDLQRARFAVLQGSSQQASGRVIFPRATFKALASESDAATEVAVGRADAAIFSEFSSGSLLQNNRNLRALGGPPLFVDANTYFMPQGDIKLWQWVSNWLRYQAAHQTMAGLWKKWVGPSARRFGLATSLVGANGEQVPFIR